MYQNYNDISYAESPFGTLSQYMTKTFGWMFAGLLVTFAVGIGTVTSGLVYLLAGTGLIFLTSIAELVMVFVLSARITKLQPSTATGLFFGYAVLNGINLSTIFL
ncbi:Bax inhibitor-1 family protein, partial [bacterium]|nr:Bax inhibitor-1 family protein [bacterium]